MMRRHTGFTLIELLIVIAIIAILALIAIPNFLEAQTRAKVSRSQSDIRTQGIAMEAYFVDYNSYTRDSDSSLDCKDVDPGPGFTCPSMDRTHPDWGKFANGALCLTTPIAYITSLLSDPFVTQVKAEGAGAMGYRIASGTWSYANDANNQAGTTPINTGDHQGSHEVFAQVGARPCFAIIGVGPDGARARMGYKCFPYVRIGKTASQDNCTDTGPTTALIKGGQPGCWMEYDPTNGTLSIGDIYRFGGDAGNSGHWMLNGKVLGQRVGDGTISW